MTRVTFTPAEGGVFMRAWLGGLSAKGRLIISMKRFYLAGWRGNSVFSFTMVYTVAIYYIHPPHTFLLTLSALRHLSSISSTLVNSSRRCITATVVLASATS